MQDKPVCYKEKVLVSIFIFHHPVFGMLNAIPIKKKVIKQEQQMNKTASASG